MIVVWTFGSRGEWREEDINLAQEPSSSTLVFRAKTYDSKNMQVIYCEKEQRL